MYNPERTGLLEELGRVQRRIKRNPHLASDAQAILFRLRELRQLARMSEKLKVTGGDAQHPA
jgi:tRNA U34 5-methylaminomethyl-2-thiouridine-forming methyltransferase MnmC